MHEAEKAAIERMKIAQYTCSDCQLYSDNICYYYIFMGIGFEKPQVKPTDTACNKCFIRDEYGNKI